MAFDFYFAGSQCDESTQLIRELNGNVLKSFVNDKKSIEMWFEYRRQGWHGKLMIDNGAFTFYRQGGSLDIDKYIAWLNENDEYIDYAVALDDIPGKWREGHTAEEVKVSAEKTWNNYLYMKEHTKSPQKLLPVFHMGEHFDNLKRYLECEDLEYMCISALKDITNKQREEWYSKCYSFIYKMRPDIKVHCLGSATLQNAEKFPFTSMDATSWIMTGANGNIFTDNGVIYVGNRRILTDEETSILENMLKEYGITVEQVCTDYRYRMLANVHYLYKKSRTTEFKNNRLTVRRLF